MDVNEFIKRLDALYDAMDRLDEKLKLRTNENISEYAHHVLGHKVKELIEEFFNELK